MQSLNEKTWAQLSAFGDDAPLCIKTTDSSIDGVRLIDDDEKSVPYVTRSDSNNGLARFVSPKNYEFGSDDGGCITLSVWTRRRRSISLTSLLLGKTYKLLLVKA